MVAGLLEPVHARPTSLTEIAFDRIRDAIVSRSLAPGTRVSESMLSELLKVSKTPVREALLRLCHIGLVEPTTKGLRVVMPNEQLIRDAYELRSGLELTAATTAARRGDTAAKKAISEAGQKSWQCAKDNDPVGFSEWDVAFHRAVADATGNRLLAKAIEDSVSLAFTLRSRDVPDMHDSVECGAQHVDIAEKIAAGQADKAGRAMLTHINGVMQMILKGGLLVG
jgi:GntR family transcriptional regulator, rspAB operon transcriptional repressor